jgi:bifunctional non-homologous end joining protein LigD
LAQSGRLVSRNGRELRRFRELADDLARTLKCNNAILDGEVVVKDPTGRPIFIDLMKRRADASYVAFDLLWLNGRDLRRLPLIDRKRALRRLLSGRSTLIEEALWVPERGRMLFTVVQQHDLEGIVAKRKDDAYTPSARWIKIKNPKYSQVAGRGELFNPPDKKKTRQ